MCLSCTLSEAEVEQLIGGQLCGVGFAACKGGDAAFGWSFSCPLAAAGRGTTGALKTPACRDGGLTPVLLTSLQPTLPFFSFTLTEEGSAAGSVSFLSAATPSALAATPEALWVAGMGLAHCLSGLDILKLTGLRPLGSSCKGVVAAQGSQATWLPELGLQLGCRAGTTAPTGQASVASEAVMACPALAAAWRVLAVGAGSASLLPDTWLRAVAQACTKSKPCHVLLSQSHVAHSLSDGKQASYFLSPAKPSKQQMAKLCTIPSVFADRYSVWSEYARDHRDIHM